MRIWIIRFRDIGWHDGEDEIMMRKLVMSEVKWISA